MRVRVMCKISIWLDVTRTKVSLVMFRIDIKIVFFLKSSHCTFTKYSVLQKSKVESVIVRWHSQQRILLLAQHGAVLIEKLEIYLFTVTIEIQN
jgi:hypothetical protein